MLQDRKLLFQVTAPAILIGLLLFISCLISAWYINRLQASFAHILSRNVTSLQSAQELEIRARQLRFHCFLYLINPTPARLEPINQDQDHFQDAFNRARETAYTEEEKSCITAIDAGYQKYLAEMAALREQVSVSGPRSDFARLADAHPIRYVVEPSQVLFRLNKEAMKQTSRESERVTQQAKAAMILLGLLGPAGGLLMGYGMAQILRRSIYKLSVRVHGVAQRLDQDVASVNVAVDGDIKNLDRQLDHILGRVEEVGERLQKHQRDMIRAEQLAAVGQLAAGVAHEIRNPLTSVKMLVEAARRPRNSKPLRSEDLDVIHGEITRLEQTVQGLLDFARPPTPRRSPWELRDVIDQAVELVQARARQQKVELHIVQPDLPAKANIDRDQICSVLVNLFLNALDALPGGGSVEVQLQEVFDGIRLTVTDSGDGIAPAMAGRLFTPFASTKPTGTGLGLSISRRIVEEHEGSLTAESQAGSGACFVIRLPSCGSPLAASSTANSRLLTGE